MGILDELYKVSRKTLPPKRDVISVREMARK